MSIKKVEGNKGVGLAEKPPENENTGGDTPLHHRSEVETHPAQRNPIGDTIATAENRARQISRREVLPKDQDKHDGGY